MRRGERILAATPDHLERWIVATDRALYLPENGDRPAGGDRVPDGGERASSEHRRRAWEVLERGEWDRDAEVLRVTETAGFGEQVPVSTYALAEEPERRERLLRVIRERVTASVVLATHVALRGADGVRVVGRRPPGQDGEVVWAVVFDPRIDPNDPEVLADAGRALEEVRAQVET